MEISAPGIILSVTPFSEADAIASIFFEDHGVYRGLARGGRSRAHAALWQAGNLAEARWIARLSDQLGVFVAEPIHAAAALAMDDPWQNAMLASICAVAEVALPEREAHPRIFAGLLHLVAHLTQGMTLLPDIIRWEAGLLQDLGYGMDLATCAVDGGTDNLAFVSPRTGRAVSAHAAGIWKEKLLPLPRFLISEEIGEAPDWAAGLKLTGHFLARDAFGAQHKGMPAARMMLQDKVEKHVLF
jgi:DNA repair protein RecO (recombination protein O)